MTNTNELMLSSGPELAWLLSSMEGTTESMRRIATQVIFSLGTLAADVMPARTNGLQLVYLLRRLRNCFGGRRGD
jgi:hypothetical protein